MHVRLRDFLLPLIVVAAAPAWAQMAAPAGSDQRDAHGDATIPDFSGMWGHPYLFPSFEPPLSGRGPLANKSRRKQIYDAYGPPLAPGTAPRLVGNNNELVGDYNDPILKPDAAAAVKKHGEIEISGLAAPNPSNQCWPNPVPYIFWNFGIQILQQPDRITILYDENHESRHVRLNQPHPAQVTPSWYGDSVGHYEGDTLVVDTVGIKADRMFAMIDMFGTPYTPALHVVERYRLLPHAAAKEAQDRAGDELYRLPGPAEGWAPDANHRGPGLQLHFTVEDDGVYTRPWSATITYRRPTATEWPELVCADNPHEYYAGKDSAVPRADKPDF
jgi:hypothetical protein